MTEGQLSEALLQAPHGLSFTELKDLVEYLDQMQEGSSASMGYFRNDRAGFQNRIDPALGATKTSKASTATCLAYLKATGALAGNSWTKETRDQLRSDFVTGQWKSAGLPENNPFTASFLLEAIHSLGGRAGLDNNEEALLDKKILHLNNLLRKGGLYIKKYPATAFLTHKVVRVLTLWDALDPKSRDTASVWNWSHLYQESMLIAADSPDADYFELAYSVLTASLTTGLDRMTPRERRLLQHAIGQFFAGQRVDGNWPRSRPLFLYPNIGYAYCYDYELLVQLLSERPLRQFLMPHLPKLRAAAWALVGRRVPLVGGEAYGWSSEHHGGHSEAESWPTASVLHFCFELRDLVFDAVRQDVFEFVDAVYEEPKQESTVHGSSPLDGLLDSTVEYKEVSHSFKQLFEDKFLKPLLEARNLVRDGQALPEINISAILYGPPGTSKTRLAGMVSTALGWPLLSLDPSHLTRRGLDNVHAEANELFGRLQFCDQIVVLMDEFDELVREREGTGELQSRFLTTAMLPKIAGLHERRRLVYIVATNHVEQFDAAISRPGRFDIIVPMMPPTAKEKLAKWKPLADAREILLSDGTLDSGDLDREINDLTYAEAEALSVRVSSLSDFAAVKGAFDDAMSNCTLNMAVDPSHKHGESGEPVPENSETWKFRLRDQQTKIQGLGL